MYCLKCGQPLAAGARFCGGCGNAVKAAHSAASPEGGARQPAAMSGMAGAGVPPGSGPAMAGAGAGLGSGAATGGGAGGGNGGSFGGGSASESPPRSWEGLLARVRGILFAPKQEWPVIAEEPGTAMGILQWYVLPLAAVIGLISFVRASVIGVSIPFAGTIRVPMTDGLLNGVLTAVMSTIGVCVLAAIINVLAPRFGGTREWRQAVKASAYALTPGFAGSLFGLLPSLGTLLALLAGIYGIYVLYLGLPAVMRSQHERAGAYTAWVVVCSIVLGLVLAITSAGVGFSSAYLFSGTRPAASQELEREQGAAIVANVIGGALGTDDKGKAGLASALSNIAKAGEEMDRARAAARPGSADTNAAANSLPSTDSGAAAGSGTADAAQNAVGAAGGLLTALGGALGGSNPKQPVDFHALQGALPVAAAGLARVHIEGSTKEALGMKGASAHATYGGEGGAPRIEIQVTDMAAVAGLMGLADAMPTETTESDTRYEKDVTIRGRKAHAKFEQASKHGELSTIVAKRFSVDVTGDGVSMEQLESALGDVDLSALESLKDSGGAR